MDLEQQHCLQTLVAAGILEPKVLLDKLISLVQDHLDEEESNHFRVALIKCLVPMLEKFANVENTSGNRDQETNVEEIHSKVLCQICIPVLKCLKNNTVKSFADLLHHTCKLIELSFAKASTTSMQQLLDLNLEALQIYNEEKHMMFGKVEIEHSDKTTNIWTTLEILKSILAIDRSSIRLDNQWLDRIFSEMNKSVSIAEDKVASRIIGIIIPRILDLDPDKQGERLVALWDTIETLFNSYGQKTFASKSRNTSSQRPYLLLCGVANWLFPTTGTCCMTTLLESQTDFWKILQCGFFHVDNLTRKRTMYLLKRILDITETRGNDVHSGLPEESPLFWWKSTAKEDLARTWQDYILLVESLEEKQVHVIRPLMPKLQHLVRASSNTEHGVPLLHSSWLATIFQRAANHESSYISRWAVIEMLSIDLSTCPMFQQDLDEFICGPLIQMLTDVSVFHRSPDVPLGSCPPAAQHLITFFQTCHAALQPQDGAEFFRKLIGGIKQQNWSGTSLTFVAQALAQLPPSKLWNVEAAMDIRELLTYVIATLETYFRAAIQCFLATSLCHLVDTTLVGPDQFCLLLAPLRRQECLQRGTRTYLELMRLFQAVSQVEPLWTPQKLRQYLDISIAEFLQIPLPSEGDDVYGIAGSPDCQGPIRMLLLCVDSGILLSLETDPQPDSALVSVLHPVTEIVMSAASHAYMSAAKAERALLFLITLLEEAKPVSGECDQLHNTVVSLLEACTEDLLLYIHRKIVSDIAEMKDVRRLHLYADMLVSLGNVDTIRPLLMTANNMTLLVDTCLHILRAKTEITVAGQLRRLCSQLLLARVCDLLTQVPRGACNTLASKIFSFYKYEVTIDNLIKPKMLDAEKQFTGRKGSSNSSWGKISCDFLSAQWTCMWYVITYGPRDSGMETEESMVYMEKCLEALNLIQGEAVVPVFNCMAALVPRVLPEMVVTVLHVCWKRVKEEGTPPTNFWRVYKAFIQLAYQPVCLATGRHSNIHQVLTQCSEEIMELGEERQGMANLLVSHLCTYWRKQQAFDAPKFVDLIVQAITFGPVYSKGTRFLHEVRVYLESLGDKLSTNQLLQEFRNERTPNQVRATVISFLAQLKPYNQQQQQLAQEVVTALMYKQREYLAVKSFRNFPNSLVHRQKHRLFTAILVLQPFIDQDSWAKVVIRFLLEMLQVEFQPSVRCQAEWLIIRLLYTHTDLLDLLWKELSNMPSKKGSYMCSLLVIMTHLARLHQDNKNKRQEVFINRALNIALPWCTCHHFNTRVFAQATVLTLWKLCKERNLSVILKTHPIIEMLVDFDSNCSFATKHTRVLRDNFTFTFDSVRDYSIETIFHTLPRLTGLGEEEWISPSHFLLANPHWSIAADHNLPLYNSDDQLKNCTPGTWKHKGHSSLSPSEDDDEEGSQDGDVQKKMIPWKTMLPQDDLDLDLQEDYQKKRQRTGGLILVTSLIDKIPNLGGLCRTSEIFGVSEFVISSIKHTNDKMFETLSVTAQKWIPVKEVMPHLLKDYLLEQRLEGYTLVGAEQTANSVCLTQYQFPEKTLLLLGNEKEGIPVELIQLLDVCVQIPQQGIIRSLNVHVSGALLIWEYTRQQLMKSAQ